MITLDAYLCDYSYNLNKQSPQVKEFVIFEKKSTLYLPNQWGGNRKDAVLKYPGFIRENSSMFDTDYWEQIYDKYYLNVFTPPRGYLNPGVTVICGQAPGESKLSFGESNWLFGPSSEKLHKLLSFNNNWYFTNVVKEPFPGNKENIDITAKYLESIVAELQFFNKTGSKFIFLGAYSIYNQVAEEAGLKNWLRIKHPSFWCYRGDAGMENEQRKIQEFLK